MSSTPSNQRPNHEWSQALQKSSHIRGTKTQIIDTKSSVEKSSLASLNRGSIFVSVFESEKIVESLQAYPVEEIGSSSFLQMYACDVERLSLQAHASAQMNHGLGGDEYIVEAILTFSKIPILVKTLLAVEAWRMYVLQRDHLAPLVAKNGNSLRCAFTLHVETTLVGLLNLIFFREEAFTEIDPETSVAIIDYCARNMAKLAIPLQENEIVQPQKEPKSVSELSQHLQRRSSLDYILENSLETEFKTAVGATSLARYFCEHFETLPLSAQTRILDTHDYLIMMVPLIDEPPWTRRRIISERDGTQKPVWEKYIDNTWQTVESENLLELTKCEAQCWLSIFYLTCSQTCRSRYGLNSFRKDQLLRLRKFVNDILLDQLPVLSEVMRYMDELALMHVPETSTGQGSAMLMQQVSLLRDSVVRGMEWKDVATRQYEVIFSNITDRTDEILKQIADIYSLEEVEDLLGQSSHFDLTSQKVGKVILQLSPKTNEPNKSEDTVDYYILKMVGNSTITETNNGPFQRTKMELSAMDDSKETKGIPPDSRMEMTIQFEGEIPHEVTLKCDALDLPTVEDLEQLESLPKMEWRQLGSIQERLVVQIGFRKLDTPMMMKENSKTTIISYQVYTAFLSQPCAEV